MSGASERANGRASGPVLYTFVPQSFGSPGEERELVKVEWEVWQGDEEVVGDEIVMRKLLSDELICGSGW